MSRVLSGLDVLERDFKNLSFPQNVGLLCHAASVNKDYTFAPTVFKNLFKDRFKKIFGPQHGLLVDVQDDMIESHDFVHPYYNIPVFSLYSKTRAPTKEMLEGLDVIFVDLQDIGTRIYTYIYTMTLLMKECEKYGIKVVILDRPNPINGVDIEGNILDLNYKSFVGLHPLPVRHALTIGEVALMAKKYWGINPDLQIIKMDGWKREMSFEETSLPWVYPSPNMPTVDTAYIFPGTVLYEGTKLSEGRGTTHSLEMIGHPKFKPQIFCDEIRNKLNSFDLKGFALRPMYFLPTFQKHANKSCGGIHIHITDRKEFKPWRLGQFLCKELYHNEDKFFEWKKPPYEYEYNLLPIDVINGTNKIRTWIENNGTFEELKYLENENLNEYLNQRKDILIY